MVSDKLPDWGVCVCVFVCICMYACVLALHSIQYFDIIVCIYVSLRQLNTKLQTLVTYRPIPSWTFVNNFVKAYYLPTPDLLKWVGNHPVCYMYHTPLHNTHKIDWLDMQMCLWIFLCILSYSLSLSSLSVIHFTTYLSLCVCVCVYVMCVCACEMCSLSLSLCIVRLPRNTLSPST